MFTYKLVSIKTKGYLVFYCEEGPSGEKNDLCYFRIELRLKQFVLPSPYKEIKAPIKKVVKSFNWLRHNIFEKIGKIKDSLQDFFVNINNDVSGGID